ncbi:hypothetical protein NC652_007142 [Populus alba x Populus x berolinensis]|uniref:Uncharacterized protein n=1 Tax=Populus alba x Populus x berolinensis TaxID=444605 RepID=A0AAD6RG01_9ROSI|nr:hypothetical protein NC652_007142 [Populus alba x Populus x berolinensis]KAJ7008264.1 hypothetical protein NC653_007066 [Populus alba x Populus x berolinensis]
MTQNHNQSLSNPNLLSQIMVMIQKQMFPHQNPATGMTQNQSLRGIEGLVLCKQGFNYTPIKGALVRIACMAVDTNGYETTPFSCLTGATDANGYYYKPLPAFGLGDLKVTECKAYLESSPLETCKIPTDVNNGMSGALLSSYHILSSKNIKLYSMRTFFYTSETTPTPAGGY